MYIHNSSGQIEMKKKKLHGNTRSCKASEVRINIRATSEERDKWYEKAKDLGYDNFADCVRDLILKAA